ncbi:CNNM domain-containing protein [Kamptonema cortianum]|nr:CNNM domain-containing protein [Oscillatoria laete-virens]MDK3159404.1 CNNM domain-containing protein [Kamptonema cortianum]MDL5050433.1 CNNM domain-containing protein [Oscillatoria amoena NRMC-F 0135]MDL5054170.1 CNNM domain-containing protein [Oscillatoria laete-virens NRMC-F 0139]
MGLDLLFYCGLCWLATFLCTGMETGIMSLDRLRLRDRVRRGQPSALILNQVIEHPEKQLSVIFVLNTFMQTGAALFFAEWVFQRTWGTLWLFAALALYLCLFIVLVKMLPKSVFRDYALEGTLLLARPLLWVTYALYPFVWIAKKVAELVMRFFHAEQPKQALFAARDEIRAMARDQVSNAEISPEEKQMIGGVFDFQNVKARDVMLPMGQAVTTNPFITPSEFVSRCVRQNLSRLPVVDDSGEVLGIVSVYDILYDPYGSHHKTLRDYIHRPLFVDETENADTVLQKLGRSRQPVAFVRNARGETVGMLTFGNLAFRILGKVCG